MGTVGLTLRWEEDRISSAASEGGRRVEPSEIAAGQNRETGPCRMTRPWRQDVSLGTCARTSGCISCKVRG